MYIEYNQLEHTANLISSATGLIITSWKYVNVKVLNNDGYVEVVEPIIDLDYFHSNGLSRQQKVHFKGIVPVIFI